MVLRRQTGRSCWVHIDGGRVVRILVPRFTLNMAPSWALFFPLSLCCHGTFCDEEEENYAVALVLFPLPLSSLMTPPGNQTPISPLILELHCAYKNGGGRTLCFFRSGRKRQDPQHTSWFLLLFACLAAGSLRVSVRARVGDGRRSAGCFWDSWNIIIIDVLCDLAKKEGYIHTCLSDVVVDSGL